MKLTITQRAQIFKERVMGFVSRLTPLKVIQGVLFTFLVAGLIVFLYNVGYSLYSRPKDVVISNITSTSATISWRTEIPSKGLVYYNTKDAFLPWFVSSFGHEKAFDDRDVNSALMDCVAKESVKIKESITEDFTTDLDSSICDNVEVEKVGNYYLHHVTLSNLNQDSQYFFRVGDGFWGWNLGVTEINTFVAEETVQTPMPIFGKVTGPNQAVSDDAIVYFEFFDGENRSIKYSSITNDQGGWYMDASSLLNSDGKRLKMDPTQDMFMAYGSFENKGYSEEINWVFGQFDGAYPDIEVIGGNYNRIKSSVVFSSYAAKAITDGSCTAVIPGKCSKEDVNANCSVKGWGNCMATNTGDGGVVDAKAMEKMGLCNNAAQCAGNLSSFTGTPIRQKDYEKAKDKGEEIIGISGLIGAVKTCPGGGTVTIDKPCPEIIVPPVVELVDNTEGSGGVSATTGTNPKIGDIKQTGTKVFIFCESGWIEAGVCPANRVVEESSFIKRTNWTVDSMGNTVQKTELVANINGREVDLDSLFPENSDEYETIKKTLDDPKNKGEVAIEAVPLDIVSFVQKELASNSSKNISSNMKNLIELAYEAEKKNLEYHNSMLNEISGDWATSGNVITQSSPLFDYYGNYAATNELGQEAQWKKVGKWVFGGSLAGGVAGTTVTGSAATGASAITVLPAGTTTAGLLTAPTTTGLLAAPASTAIVPYGTTALVTSGTNLAVGGGTVIQGTVVGQSTALGTGASLAPVGALALAGASLAAMSNSIYGVWTIDRLPGENACWGAQTGIAGMTGNYCTLEEAKAAIAELPEFLEDTPDALKEGYIPVIADSGRKDANGDAIVEIVVVDKKAIDAEQLEIEKRAKSLEDALNSIPDGMTEQEIEGNLNNVFMNKVQAQDSSDKVTPADGSVFYLPEFGYYSLELGDFTLSKQITENDHTVYIFYLESNGVEGFQVPKDIDNPQSGEDMIVKSSAYEIKLEKEATTKEFELAKGINLVSFDLIPTEIREKSFSAKDLFDLAYSQGVYIKFVSYFADGRWADGIKCEGTSCLGSDFPILPGKGYVVVLNEKSKITLPGYKLNSQVPIALYNGWNLVGFHGYKTTYTAESFLKSVNELETVKADNVTWYPTVKSKYEGLQVVNDMTYGYDFQLKPSLGYFVRVTTLTPEDIACKSVIWHEDGELHGKCGDSKSLF